MDPKMRLAILWKFVSRLSASMTFHDLGMPKTHPKSISKSIPKTARFWNLLGPYFGSLLASRWLQHGFQSSQDGSKTTQGASKTRLICLQDRPSTSQDTSRTAPSAPKAPARLSKSLQDGSLSLQGASKRSPEEVFEIPNRLQERSRGSFQASSSWPATSSLWPASGLGGMREQLIALLVQKWTPNSAKIM